MTSWGRVAGAPFFAHGTNFGGDLGVAQVVARMMLGQAMHERGKTRVVMNRPDRARDFIERIVVKLANGRQQLLERKGHFRYGNLNR